MGPRAGVFCHNGLGDGVNCLVLSHHLHFNGWNVDTYQNTIGSMQSWFPHLEVKSYPKMADLPRILSAYDWYFVVHNDSDEFVKALILEGKRRFPDQIKVLYFYPSRNIINEPYYSDCLTDPKVSIAENLRRFCDKVLHLPKLTQSNGFIPPADLVYQKYPKRIVIHPTSARATRSWPKENFVKLALHLEKQGYKPSFIPGTREGWADVLAHGFEVPVFPTLDVLSRYIYESGYLIGNDSGPGHLASAVGIPTLTFCRRKALSNMWAPSFHHGVVITPSAWIPNIRGFRLRDRYWKQFITVGMARRAFEKLARSSS